MTAYALVAVAFAPVGTSAIVDRHIDAGLVARGVRPAPRADDAAFYRRVHLALAGVIPRPADARKFLEDADPKKRQKAVDALLAAPAFAAHYAAVWRAVLIPEAAADPNQAALAGPFEQWAKARIAAGQPFDQFAREILTYGGPARRGAGMTDDTGLSPVGFYTAKEAKPENLAAATSRVFLGVQLECAQCHDHPFAKWSREQFWGLAAFFGGLDRKDGTLRELPDRRELPIPNTDRLAVPMFLDDKEPVFGFRSSGRVALADWMTAKGNPFFARAAVNRVWGQFFGVGLVDPVDDFNDKNVPSHPELLDELARDFAAGGYDVRGLIRGIVLSETYQRSSVVSEPGHADVRGYGRFPVQGLSPEQFADSLLLATGAPARAYDRNQPQRPLQDLFANTGKRTETPTTILQSLALMNGPLTSGSRTVTAAVGIPGLTPADRIECLYFAALSRPPRPEESARALRHVRTGAKDEYADVFWALLNSVEFRTIH